MRNDAAARRFPAPWFFPRFSPLLERREWAVWSALIVMAHVILDWLGLGGMGCPIREFTGVPCPGCGLTTAARHAIAGEWSESCASHIFLPIFALGFTALILVSVLPGTLRRVVIDRVTHWEDATGFTTVLWLALLSYWALRAF
jgi:hypothetical protein